MPSFNPTSNAYSVTRYGKPLDDTAKGLVYQQKERLEGSNETEVAISDTYDNLPLIPFN